MTDPASDRSPAPAASPDFPVVWLEPADAESTWEWDDMHMPSALAPLAADYVRTLSSGFAYRYHRLDVPATMLVRVWNGYAYFTLTTDVPEPERPAMFERAIEARRAHIPLADAYWRERAIPELREIYEWVAARPVETLPAPDLADTWHEVWQRIVRCWSIHFYAIVGPYQVMDDLADLYESIVEKPAPGEGLALIGGGIHELQDVEQGLEHLAAMASAVPALVALLAEPNMTMEQVADVPDATAFVAGLDAFLAAHGHLGQSFDDLALPSWAEAPELLLTELAKRVAYPPRVGAAERRARLATKAEALADSVRKTLADDPDRRSRFEALLATARQIGPLTEVHNYWIDRMAQASMRRFVIRIGRRLVEGDVIDEPADIFFLRSDEVPALLMQPADRRTVVLDRRDELLHWAAVRPPRHVGKPAVAGQADRFDGERFAPPAPDVLRGTGASVGVVRGRARVTRTQADFGSIQPGDIIVCPSSNPSWVPLFGIAGGLITDTGGVLSHAAVVAREFGLPAVVGTGDATTRIADGRLVELDGSSGLVRLL